MKNSLFSSVEATEQRMAARVLPGLVAFCDSIMPENRPAVNKEARAAQQSTHDR
jgi:hypothetical protein